MIDGINLNRGVYIMLTSECNTEKEVFRYFQKEISRWTDVDSCEVDSEDEWLKNYNTCLAAMSTIRIRNVSQNMMKCMKIRTVQHCLNEFADDIAAYMDKKKQDCPTKKLGDYNARESQLQAYVSSRMPDIINKVVSVLA